MALPTNIHQGRSITKHRIFKGYMDICLVCKIYKKKRWGIVGTLFLCVTEGVYTVQQKSRDECVSHFINNDWPNN